MDLSDDKLREFVEFLSQSRFKPYAPGTKALYKTAPYHIVLRLNSGREFDLRYADAYVRMIVMGSGEFQINPNHRFDFDIPPK